MGSLCPWCPVTGTVPGPDVRVEGVTSITVSPAAWCHHQHGATSITVSPTLRCHQQHGVTISTVSPAARCYHQHYGVTSSTVSPAARCHQQHSATTSSTVSPAAWCYRRLCRGQSSATPGQDGASSWKWTSQPGSAKANRKANGEQPLCLLRGYLLWFLRGWYWGLLTPSCLLLDPFGQGWMPCRSLRPQRS